MLTTIIDVLPFVATILLLFIVLEGIYIIKHLYIAQDLGKKVSPPQQNLCNPKERILIMGDSFTLGTGAANYQNSIGGRLATDYPNAEIINLSENAVGVTHVANKINNIPDGTLGHFDIIIIRVGAMDILSFKSTRKTALELNKLIDATREKLCPSGQIIFLSPGNLGRTKLYQHFPVGILFSWQSKKLHRELSGIAEKQNITYVDLYADPQNEPWSGNPAFMAKDRIHPNDEGYGILYGYVRRVISR